MRPSPSGTAPWCRWPSTWATVFLPGVVNSFLGGLRPHPGGAISTAITLLGEAFQGMASLVNQASATIISPPWPCCSPSGRAS